MPVFIDALIDYGWKLGPSCHMLVDPTDNIEDLHVFAESIGLKRSWFQNSPKDIIPHYDLTAGRRKAALKGGAIEIDRRKMCDLLNSYREAKKSVK